MIDSVAELVRGHAPLLAWAVSVRTVFKGFCLHLIQLV